MAISYPITFPTTKGLASINIRPVSIVGVGTSIYTGEQQVQAHQGQLWAADVSLPLMKRADAEEYIAALLKLNGREGTLLLGDTSGATPRGSVDADSAGPQVDGASQTGQTLDTKNWTSGASGVLLAGDYIQLGSGGSTRLHRVLNDVNADSAGKATIDIWPKLRSSPGDGDSITTSNTLGLFRLAQRVEIPTDFTKFYDISFSCIEAL